MATRTKQADLVALAELINTRLGIDDDDEKYTVGRQDGSPRLHRKRQSVDVSPRLPAGRLEDWMSAFLEGISVGQGSGWLVRNATAEIDSLREVVEDVDGGSDAIEDAARDLLRAGHDVLVVHDTLYAAGAACSGCGESYSPDDEELHERCAS